MKEQIISLIKMALAEDIGSGDMTSIAFIPESSRSRGRIITRKPVVVAGLSTVVEIFRQIDTDVVVTLRAENGQQLNSGETLLELEGPSRSLLLGERVALNFLGKLIGIATLTHTYVEAVQGTGVAILDTRKMTPGWRVLEKEAVKAGGGKNHRIGLFDAILVKDNHLAALGEEYKSLLPEIVKESRRKYPNIKIEIEADTLEQVDTFLGIPEVNAILLDNMSLETMRSAVAMKNNKAPSVLLEASGGITLENVRAVAEAGIDEISLGALTHSVSWADLSMELY